MAFDLEKSRRVVFRTTALHATTLQSTLTQRKRLIIKCYFNSGIPVDQCDKIGRFIELWATFQSLWQQIICPFGQIFLKVSKSIIFLVKSFLGNFYRHLAIFYWSHCSEQSYNHSTL